MTRFKIMQTKARVEIRRIMGADSFWFGDMSGGRRRSWRNGKKKIYSSKVAPKEDVLYKARKKKPSIWIIIRSL